MQKIIHFSQERGHAKHGWLESRHSFSFGDYYHVARMGFGLLRVLNDDLVAPNMGFGEHPHRDMEIISIPLLGELHHRDNQGNESRIKAGDVQIMSAGTGIIHSEFNASQQEPVQFLQIWIHPAHKGLSPSYDQKHYLPQVVPNQFLPIVSPTGGNTAVKINQNAYLSLARIDQGQVVAYQQFDDRHGTYFFLIDGKVEESAQSLNKRDALGIIEVHKVDFKALVDSQLLAIEVPLS